MQSGDVKGCFEHLVTQHHRDMYLYIWRLTRGVDATEDPSRRRFYVPIKPMSDYQKRPIRGRGCSNSPPISVATISGVNSVIQVLACMRC